MRFFFLFLFFSFPALAHQIEGCPWEDFLRSNFPGTKVGSRGKAYVYWRNRAFTEPDTVFDHLVGPRKREIGHKVELGGYLVGFKSAAGPRPFVPLDAKLSAHCKLAVERFYATKPNVLFTRPEILERADQLVDRAVTRHGSIDAFLKAHKVELELTPGKARELRQAGPKSAGKYIIAEDGRAFFLNNAELNSLKDDLGVPSLQHGVMAAILNRAVKPPVQAVIDYGTTYYGKNGEFSHNSNQSNWNPEKEHQIESLAYLNNYR